MELYLRALSEGSAEVEYYDPVEFRRISGILDWMNTRKPIRRYLGSQWRRDVDAVVDQVPYWEEWGYGDTESSSRRIFELPREAEQDARALIKVREETVGSEHPLTLEVRADLANTLRRQGKCIEAEAEARKVIKLQEKVLPPGDPDLLFSCYQLALCLRDEGKFNQAKEFAKRAAEGTRKVSGIKHREIKRYEKLLSELEAKL
jgi:tetratricopeptide (TPR) repeat protein